MIDNEPPQPSDDVILECPYKAFGYLQVTKTKLVFKRIWPGFNTFEGIIYFSDLVEVRYIEGVPMFGVPSLELVYRLPKAQTRMVRIRFPAMFGRLSGLTPKKIFETIMSLKENVEG